MHSPVTKPALRYYGGKFASAPNIIRHLPQHHCYVEPFGGGMSVLLRKPQSSLDVYNDADQRVVNFFKVLRERTDELMQQLKCTAYSRRELEIAYSDVEDDGDLDDLESARRFYVRAWQSYGAHQNVSTGWRFQHSPNGGKKVADDWKFDHLLQVVERLRGVLLECGDYTRILERYDTPRTLFYCDPPYPKGTRSKQHGARGYRCELSEQDHRDLAKHLQELKGMVLLSSYPSPLYQELYEGWRLVEWTAQTNSTANRTECLWLSPNTVKALGYRQLSLLGGEPWNS
jgi:DNA adenine methylase